MNTSAAPILRPAANPQPVARPRLAAPLAALPDLQAGEPAELRRWLLMLGTPFVVSAGFFAAAIGTGAQWLIGPSIAFGPGLIILAFIYLSLTSDAEMP